jgi:hypothetical protein
MVSTQVSTSRFNLPLLFLLSPTLVNAGLTAPPNTVRGRRQQLKRSHIANLQSGIDDAGGEPQTRIVGGEISDPGEFPYFVDLNGCGGTLISPRVVLTACKSNVCIVGDASVIKLDWQKCVLTAARAHPPL